MYFLHWYYRPEFFVFIVKFVLKLCDSHSVCRMWSKCWHVVVAGANFCTWKDIPSGWMTTWLVQSIYKSLSAQKCFNWNFIYFSPFLRETIQSKKQLKFTIWMDQMTFVHVVQFPKTLIHWLTATTVRVLDVLMWPISQLTLNWFTTKPQQWFGSMPANLFELAPVNDNYMGQLIKKSFS